MNKQLYPARTFPTPIRWLNAVAKFLKQYDVQIACIMIGLISVCLRYPTADTYTYTNMDATSHVLLTLKSYDETPAAIHKFLPINTLAGENNKFIDNGPSMIMDLLGNSYYTSFSGLGFYIPYLFMKLTHLPITEQSLYLYNSLIYLLSCFLLGKLFCAVFKNRLNDKFTFALVAVIYLFQLETMHSQGIVYWSHSLFQLLFIVQVLAFVNMESNKYRYLFFALCFILPYLEWTGFFSNLGFILAMVFFSRTISINRKHITLCTKTSVRVVIIAILTALSLAYYYLRFVLLLDKEAFLNSLYYRFLARSQHDSVVILDLAKAYFESYAPLIIIIFFMLPLIGIKSIKRKMLPVIREDFIVFFVLLFPITENLVMRSHALIYTFDRLKVILPLIYMLLLAVSAFKPIHSTKIRQQCLLLFLTTVGILNMTTYILGGSDGCIRRTKVDFLEYNSAFAALVNKNYPAENALAVQDDGWRAWGYLQQLFQRNMMCTALYPSSEIINRAKERGQMYLLVNHAPEFSKLGAIDVYNLDNMELLRLSYDETNHSLLTDKPPATVTASSLSDDNWTNGVSNTGATILFETSLNNLCLLSNATHLYIGDTIIDIASINIDSRWIGVDTNAGIGLQKFAYPNEIHVKQ